MTEPLGRARTVSHAAEAPARKQDKDRWDALRARYAVAIEAARAEERRQRIKYGDASWRAWSSRGDKNLIERLQKRADKIGDSIVELLVKVSPRGEAWLTGAPARWIREKLTWEDAIRPVGEPLSVEVPAPWGHDKGLAETPSRGAAGLSVKPGDWLEFKDPTGRTYYSGIYKVEKVGRVNVEVSQDVRFAPDGPWYHQTHKLPRSRIVRVVPASETAPGRASEPACRPCDLQGRRDESAFAACSARAKALGAITDDKKLYALVKDELIARERESFYVIGLDHNGGLVCYEEVARGQAHKVNVDVKDVMQVAARYTVDAICVAHSHPTEGPEPSDKDKELTADIRKACKDLDIVFVDHIIVSRKGGWYSFADGKSHK